MDTPANSGSPHQPYNTDQETNLGVLAQQITDLHGHEIITTAAEEAGIVTLAVLPQGKKIEDLTPILEKYLPAPRRRRGTATLSTATAFIGFMGRFHKDDDKTVVFANPNKDAPTLTAIFNYYDGESTDFADHRAVYAPKLSQTWQDWLKQDGEPMAQAGFPEVIQEHNTDIMVPNFDDPNMKTFAELVGGKFAEPSELLALSRGLQVNVDVAVRQAVTLNTGAINVQYDETHKDGQGAPIAIANLFQIAVPVFEGADAYRIAVRLRYRLQNGRLLWSYLIVRPDRVFDAAFNLLVEEVRTKASVPVYLGAPEGK